MLDITIAVCYTAYIENKCSTERHTTMYQINIERKHYSQPVNMNAIKATCATWMTDDQGRNNDVDEHGEFIYVQFGTVMDAVAAINALGYATDEDVAEEEESMEGMYDVEEAE